MKYSRENFILLIDSVFNKIKDMDIITTEDQLSNFRQAALEADVSMEIIWLIFFNENFRGIRAYLKKEFEDKENLFLKYANIVEKIDKAVLLLVLLRAILYEKDAEYLRPIKE